MRIQLMWIYAQGEVPIWWIRTDCRRWSHELIKWIDQMKWSNENRWINTRIKTNCSWKFRPLYLRSLHHQTNNLAPDKLPALPNYKFAGRSQRPGRPPGWQCLPTRNFQNSSHKASSPSDKQHLQHISYRHSVIRSLQVHTSKKGGFPTR